MEIEIRESRMRIFPSQWQIFYAADRTDGQGKRQVIRGPQLSFSKFINPGT
jgi:hypothetical protein